MLEIYIRGATYKFSRKNTSKLIASSSNSCRSWPTNHTNHDYDGDRKSSSTTINSTSKPHPLSATCFLCHPTSRQLRWSYPGICETAKRSTAAIARSPVNPVCNSGFFIAVNGSWLSLSSDTYVFHTIPSDAEEI